MTKVIFYKDAHLSYSGFSVTGHSGFAEEGKDIVCASVTSAAQLVLNLLNESFGLDCDIKIDSKKAAITCLIQTSDKNMKNKEIIQGILQGFYQHIFEYAKDYPKYISCTLSERNGLS